MVRQSSWSIRSVNFFKILKGIFQILLCWLVGNVLSALADNYISGNIIGMMLMFVALKTGVFSADSVRPVAKFLLGTMALFFVPFGVGIVNSFDLIADNALAITTATVVSTFAVIVATGWTMQYLNRRIRERR